MITMNNNTQHYENKIVDNVRTTWDDVNVGDVPTIQPGNDMHTYCVTETKSDGSSRSLYPVFAANPIDAMRQFYASEELWSIIVDARLNRVGVFVEVD